MKKLPLLTVLLLSAPVFALSNANDFSTSELVGQTIMPRVVIGEHKAFKKPIEKGEVTGFFIKTYQGHVILPTITLKNQDKFTQKQRKILVKTLKDLHKWAAKSPHKTPLFLAFDYEGGTVTSPMFMGLKQMPSNMLLAATQNVQLVREMYAQQAAEIKRVGGNMALGPDTDVNSNPANPIIQTRSFGDHAAKVGEFSAAAVRGLQEHGVPAVLKHFPGHGDTSTDSHFSQPVTNLPPDALWKTHIAAFQKPIEAGVTGVMTNHVVYPQIDEQNTAIFSAKITRNLLHNRMGFKGLVLTDGLDMDGTGSKPMKDVVLEGFAAGNDILLLTGKPREIEASAYYPKLAAQWVAADLEQPQPMIARQDLVNSVQKILDVKASLPVPGSSSDNEAEFARVARQVAEQGVTLVRDEQHFSDAIKPLQHICVVMFADGIFSKQVHRMAETLQENGKTVSYVQLPRAASAAAKQQMNHCITKANALIIGTGSTSSINPNQYELVTDAFKQTQAQGKPVALVSLLNPYEIPSYPQAKTVVALYGPTADAVAVAGEILLGIRSAKGTLPVSLPVQGKMPFEKAERMNFL